MLAQLHVMLFHARMARGNNGITRALVMTNSRVLESPLV